MNILSSLTEDGANSPSLDYSTVSCWIIAIRTWPHGFPQERTNNSQNSYSSRELPDEPRQDVPAQIRKQPTITAPIPRASMYALDMSCWICYWKFMPPSGDARIYSGSEDENTLYLLRIPGDNVSQRCNIYELGGVGRQGTLKGHIAWRVHPR